MPVAVPWLNTPNPQAEVILHANILRYLLTEHSEKLAGLVEFQNPRIWLEQVLEQARAWQWRAPSSSSFWWCVGWRRRRKAARFGGSR